MSESPDAYLLLNAFIDELARCGMQAACTSPGSRCTPIVLTLARERRLACFSHIDERCSGFFALGLAKQSGRPVAVTCTSGTAVAELYPAVIEAHEARVPLIVLSADRPPELRESGAGQTIDQIKLFGDAVKWFFEVGTHRATDRSLRWIRALACRAYHTACQGRPGVVHLNFPLREPLLAEGPLPVAPSGRPDGRPHVLREQGASSTEPPQTLAGLLARSHRGVVIAGRCEEHSLLAARLSEFCERAQWPLLADPLSGARRGTAAIANYDALLRESAFAAGHTPDLVLRVGDLPTSKPLRSWLASLTEVPQVLFDPHAAWQDPDSTVSLILATDPAPMLKAAGNLLSAAVDWLADWRSADELAGEAALGILAAEPLSEPLIARELGVLLPAQATLFVSSSMPVRDVESFWPARDDPPRVLCNRGANGIDGVLSSALGAAAGAGEGPVVLLIGDVALAHDVGGLLAAVRHDLKLTIVLVDNRGGGIFDFLPVSGDPMALAEGVYDRHIATDTGLDFARVSDLYGLGYQTAADRFEFRVALERALASSTSQMIHLRTDRDENVRLHRRVWDAVAQSIDAASPERSTDAGDGPELT